MAATVRQLADLVCGNVLGDHAVVIHAARTWREAQPGDITLLEKPEHAAELAESKAGAAVVPALLPSFGKVLIQVDDPLLAFATIHQHLQGQTPAPPTGIDPRVQIPASVQIGAAPSIAPFVVIGERSVIGKRCRLYKGAVIGKNCRLGDDVVLYPGVVLYDDIVVGDRVTIHARAVIGADGFGYRFQQGRHVKVPQLGQVVIGNDVEVGAGATIDRGTFGSTRISDGAKIDNLVQIAHNCRIGPHNLVHSQAGIAGSCTTGNHVILREQAGVKDHVHLGDEVNVGCKTGIMEDALPGQRMFLYPACEENEAAELVACLKKLPILRKNLLRVLKVLNLGAAPSPHEPKASHA